MNYEELNDYQKRIGSLSTQICCTEEGVLRDLLKDELRPVANEAVQKINTDYPEIVPALNAWLIFADVGLKIYEYVILTVERILNIQFDSKQMECSINTDFDNKGIVCYVDLGHTKVKSSQLNKLCEAFGWPDKLSLEPVLSRDGQSGLRLKFDVLTSRCLTIYNICRQCGLTDEPMQGR